MDWVSYLKDRARKSPVVLVEEIAETFELVPASVQRSLARLQSRGLVERIANGIYVNRLAHEVSETDLVNILRPCAYVSLESALRYWGISTQSPSALTCVTVGKPREYHSKDLNLRYRTVSPKLFWGFQEKTTRYGSYKLAEPEKALLDWIYLSLQDGVEPALDELDFKRLDRAKLLSDGQKFPTSVLRLLLPVLALDLLRA